MSVNLVRGAAKTGISSSFDVAKVIAVDMDMFPPTQAFRGYISMITVQLSNLSAVSKPTTLTMRICRDATGDEMIITDTTSNIFTASQITLMARLFLRSMDLLDSMSLMISIVLSRSIKGRVMLISSRLFGKGIDDALFVNLFGWL